MQFRIVFRPAIASWVVEVQSGIGFRAVADVAGRRKLPFLRKPPLKFATYEEAGVFVGVTGLHNEYRRVGIRNSIMAQLASVPEPDPAIDGMDAIMEHPATVAAVTGSTTTEVSDTLRETAKSGYRPLEGSV